MAFRLRGPVWMEAIRLDGPAKVAARIRAGHADAASGDLVVLLVDRENCALREFVVGGELLDEVTIVVRSIVSEALREGAAGVILARYLESGNPVPGPAEVRVVRRIVQGCRLVGLRFLDHVIVSRGGWFSFAEDGGDLFGLGGDADRDLPHRGPRRKTQAAEPSSVRIPPFPGDR